MSSSSTPTPSSSSKAGAADTSTADIEKLLSREATAFQRESEVERIFAAFKLNPYEILDLDQVSTPEEIKKQYRKLSLFIHPDKCSHARAPEAFDLLKKAEQELSDENKREELDALITTARRDLFKSHNIPPTTPNHDYRVQSLVPPYKTQMRLRVKEMLIDEEVRRRKAIKNNLANEGFEAAKKEEEVQQRKRKAEDDKNWEENRETRVNSWRSFASGSSTAKKQKTDGKKKKKSAILG
ncbi:chaperone regulator [Exidia glandulosa HHB12029]|uniref:Chaperone regulator n=1 Tax=Exidia glandulosa HHB12029 TaxID=1314781 RepID=A0A165L7U1_EXIGL|nr:chaperone regulator [Exidia glandulosa HHB12029]